MLTVKQRARWLCECSSGDISLQRTGRILHADVLAIAPFARRPHVADSFTILPSNIVLYVEMHRTLDEELHSQYVHDV